MTLDLLFQAQNRLTSLLQPTDLNALLSHICDSKSAMSRSFAESPEGRMNLGPFPAESIPEEKAER